MANLIARPSDAELLAWLDGDLSPERRAEVVRLLELDWEVRAQLASLERCIEAYVRVVPPPPGEEPEPFDLVWSRLSPRLQVESGEKVPVSKRSDSASGMRRWLTAGLVAILAGGALLWAVLWQGRSVSAEEVLDRAVTGEARSGQGLAQPVIYRKLEVERLGAKPERIPQHPGSFENKNKLDHSGFLSFSCGLTIPSVWDNKLFLHVRPSRMPLHKGTPEVVTHLGFEPRRIPCTIWPFPGDSLHQRATSGKVRGPHFRHASADVGVP